MMRPIKKIVFSVIILLAATTSASAATYYVSPSGSDSNPGTQTQPFQTIQKAANSVSAGDTVMVLPGIYSLSPSTSGTTEYGIKNNVSGTASARIRFISQTPWGAKLVTNGLRRVWWNGDPGTQNGSYVDIQGFDMSGDGTIGIVNYASNVRMIGNYIHDITSGLVCDQYGGAGILQTNPASTNNDIIGNKIVRIGLLCNIQPGAHAVYYGYGAGTLANNILGNAKHAALQIYPGPTGSILIANNVLFGSNTGITSYCNGCFMKNNIFYKNTYNIYESSSASGNTYQNNIDYGATYLNDLRVPVNITGTIAADPQFINYSADGSGDFHLKATSPAINAGITLSQVPTDFDGNGRPVGSSYDIGPYEYGATPPPDGNGSISVDSSYPGYTTNPIDDGIINATGSTATTWASADNLLDHWIQINFTSPQPINTASIFWAFDNAQNKYMTSQRVDVQSWNGSAWVTLGSMMYSGDVATSSINFPTVTTSQLRFFQPASKGNPNYTNILWVTEVEYGNRVISVDSTYPNYTTAPIDDEVINASGGTASTWASADSTLDHWIQIDFGSQKQINSTTVSWAFDNAQNKYMTSQRLDVQSWNGAAWITLGSLVRSSDVALSSICFPAVTTSRIRLFQPANLGNPAYTGVLWVTEVDYSNNPILPAPVFSPNGGTFSAPVSVTVTAASGASIYYTTNGSTPTTSSTLYSGPITVSATSTIKAIAVKTGMTNSPVASATFTISIPPTLNLTAAPILTWTAANATTCTASGSWNGTEPISGTSSLGSVSTTASFVLTCTGSGGTTQKTVTVNVQ